MARRAGVTSAYLVDVENRTARILDGIWVLAWIEAAVAEDLRTGHLSGDEAECWRIALRKLRRALKEGHEIAKWARDPPASLAAMLEATDEGTDSEPDPRQSPE